MTFHHLGVACSNVAEEIAHFELLGYRQEGAKFQDAAQKVEGAFMIGPGPRLELVAPLEASSPVRPWIEKGVKYYHQGFEVPCLDQALEQLAARRGIVVAAAEASVAFQGRSIAFVMLPGMILIELIQMEGKI